MICDCHNDFLTELKTKEEKINYIKNLINNKKIKYICCQIWTTKLIQPLKFIKNQYKLLKKFKSKKLLLCIEDLGFINEKNFKNTISVLSRIKPFSCGLTWNNNNRLGGGALENARLTNLGRIVVKKLESKGILIDTAHMNRQTFYDFCKITKLPIYNSHANINILHNHKRNLTNNQIKIIAKSGGFVGLSFVKDFIKNKKSKLFNHLDIIRQIEYFTSKFGYKNVGFGSDFFGAENLPNDIKNYNNLKIIKNTLKKHAFSYNKIRNIFYKNFDNFYKRVKNKISLQ